MDNSDSDAAQCDAGEHVRIRQPRDGPTRDRARPAARLLWRTGHSVQVEVGGRRVLVDGIEAGVVGELIGRPRPDADARDHPQPATTRLQQHLLRTGFLWSASDAGDLDDRLAPPHPRLGPELLALSGRYGERAGQVLSARRHASVAVEGDGRIGPYLAVLLAAAGVGAACVLDRRPAGLVHTMPGGIAPEDEGQPLAEAAERAIALVAPDTDTRPPALGDRPDLVILAADEPIDPERRAGLHAQGTAHLAVSLAVDHAVVGPLVLPGLTSCLGCADLHRLDRDPAWNALAVQLTVRPRVRASADVALAVTIAGLAALEALAFLDGAEPATIEGSLEIHATDRRVRRRSWPLHPECTCMLP